MYKVRSLPNIIVLCHLRWEFVKQRPQHLINRLARSTNVLFIEEPIEFTPTNRGTAKLIKISPNLTIVQPRIESGDFEELYKIINVSNPLNNVKPIIWLYSANFLPVLNYIDHSLLIYDCMDELSAFKGAPKELIEYEKILLSKADVVFTGGKSLFEAKRIYTKNVYCFPSSVDKKHFEKANSCMTKVPADIAHFKKPIVGFYGVIDERIDLNLLQTTAKKCPQVDFVMIGPVVKIDVNDLPQAKNIHYLGIKSYDQLPNYLKAFKIAMMPFGINQYTRFISPTKTLEFMASHKPIISTPIYDVKRDFSKEVRMVSSPSEFVNAIQYYLSETKKAKKKRIHLQNEVIKKTSWDNTVASMTSIMHKALENSESPSTIQTIISEAQFAPLQPLKGEYV